MFGVMLGAFVGLAPALGSTFSDVPTVDRLVQESATVVQGAVSATRTAPCAVGLCTTYTVAVSDTWRGEATASVEVTLPGGRFGGLTQHVAGLPRWSVGDEVVLFLDERGMVRWTSLFTVREIERERESEDPPSPARIVTDPLGRRLLTSAQELRAQVSLAESTRL